MKRLGNDGVISEFAFDLLDADRPYSKRAAAQNRPELGNVDFSSEKQAMRIGQDQLEQLRAKSSTGGIGTDKHVGIEEDPHDTIAKTSSSVRIPDLGSISERMASRVFRKRRSATWRLRASRAISLLLCLRDRERRFSSRSSLGSTRIVTVDDFIGVM